MDLKVRIDILGKEADIINKKLITLLIIDGAIWMYGIKSNKLLFFISVILFGVVSFAIVTNLLKLGRIEKKLKDLENE